MSLDNLRYISEETIQKALEAFKAGGQALQKDATTQGYTVGTGLQGYDLEAPAKSLYPVVTPYRNRVPRKKAPVGATAANWKAITDVNVDRAKPTVSFGTAGTVIKVTEKDYSAAYKAIALGGMVLLDAQNLARGFDDLRARAAVDTLYSLMIEEEIILLGGQNTVLAAPVAPTLTVDTVGGSIGAVNVGVKCAVRTLEGVRYAASGIGISNASPEKTSGVLTGSTNKITATVTAVPGAAQYDWYAGAAGGPWYFVASTAANKCVISSVPGSGTQAPTADTSADADAFTGLIPQLVAGSATYKSLDGSTLTSANGSIKEIDDVLLDLYENKKLSPNLMIMAPQQSLDISNKVISSGGATILLPTGDAAQRGNILAGNMVTRYLNKASGEIIEIMSNPMWPAGRIAIITERLPFPNSNIESVFQVETQQEYQQLEYAASRQAGTNGGPRYDFEDRCIELLKCYFPGGCAILDNIAQG